MDEFSSRREGVGYLEGEGSSKGTIALAQTIIVKKFRFYVLLSFQYSTLGFSSAFVCLPYCVCPVRAILSMLVMHHLAQLKRVVAFKNCITVITISSHSAEKKSKNALPWARDKKILSVAHDDLRVEKKAFESLTKTKKKEKSATCMDSYFTWQSRHGHREIATRTFVSMPGQVTH